MNRIGITLALILWMQISAMASNATGEFTRPNSRTATSYTVSTDNRTIVSVEKIEVKCPSGTAPRLPYQVFVHYSDGASEYRQTRWTNSGRVTEQAQADPVIHPVGREYTVKGFIIGDNTTPNGYPITAHVQVISEYYLIPDKTPLAEPLSLNKVVINGDNRLSSNRDLAILEIAGWDVTQQLYNYRDTYGLSTEGYKKADGWDSPTTKLKGHGSGHYMSALAMAFASATDDSLKIILRKNISRMINELRACQERTFVWNKELGRYWEARDFAPEEELLKMQGTWSDFDVHKTQWGKYGYGYLNAIPAHHPALIEMYRGYNNEKWVWAPYYSIHKQLAGLIDIATYIDDQEIADKALLIAKDMGLWIWNRMFYRTYLKTDGTTEERRTKPGNRYEMWNMYIAGEDGGTGESLVRLSEMVSDPVEKDRLLQASSFFDSPAFFDPLSKNIDDIRTRHANQHIPKITSALRSFRGNNNPYYYNLSENFWNMIQGRYRYSSGGVGNGEMFRQPYTQILSMATNVTSDRQRNLHPAPTINETCCAYNLAKLTKDLNCYNPDDAKYMDYYERVLYNQLVGSLDHCHYQTTYQYAVGLNASKPWGNRTPQSTCCGGTGSENHVKYQEAAYFVSENTLWVGLYMPTTLTWDAKNVKIQQDCLWPAEHSTIRLIQGTGEFSIKLRVPYWATEGFDVKLNGVSIASDYRPSSYVTIPSRRWTSSDVIEVAMPFGKHIDFGPDKMETAATGMNETKTTFDPMWVGTLMYGPLAMTATGVTNWDQASLDIDSNLGNIVLNGSSPKQTGAEGNLYTLTLNGLTFQPDYYRHNHSTHYFRINLMGDPATELKEPLIAKLLEAKMLRLENYIKKTFTALKKAIDSGEKLHLAPNVTENEISNQITAIDNAIKGLKAKGLDKSLLETVIADARSKLSDNYTWDSFDNLQRTLAETNKVNETSNSQIQVDRQRFTLEKTMDELVDVRNVDKMTLGEHLFIAKERQREQDSWNALAVKVPEYSPWAPYGFARLLEQIDRSQKVYDNKDKNYSQEEVNIAAGTLNAAINTMRPGNLPELEDIHELSSLLSKGNTIDHSKYTSEERAALKEAIEYAEMVVKYVSDGSGTHDMIESAISRLTSAIK
jgi:hypothetical protein